MRRGKLAEAEGDRVFGHQRQPVLVCDRPRKMRQRFRTRREQIKKKDHPCDCKVAVAGQPVDQIRCHEGRSGRTKVKRNVGAGGTLMSSGAPHAEMRCQCPEGLYS